jgi:hypothetical protein
MNAPLPIDPARQVLIDRIAECYDVFRRLPDPERKYRLPQLSSWPTVIRDFMDAYGWSDVRVRMPPPSPAAIDRAEEVLAWFAAHLKDYPNGARALWLTCGRGLSLQQAAIVMHTGKSTVKDRRNAALTVLLARIGADLV